MISFRAVLNFSLALVLTASPAFATTTHHSAGATHVRASSHRTSAHARRGHAAKSHKLHGQQAIQPERVTQIQQALIREHYLTGEPTGQWDSATQAAMQKYQADQGWQTRLMPDSRALVKLGLGPDYSNAINAKDVAQGSPAPASTVPSAQTAGFAAAAGVNQ